MFIACQQAMDFGEEHNAAMDVRLRKFFFKTLKKPPVAGVQQFLKSHAMDCLVWASSLAKTPDDELPPPFPGTASEDDLLDENEKELIRNVSLIEDSESDHAAGDDDDAVQETCLQSEDDQEEDDEADEQSSTSSPSDSWEKSIAKISKLRAQQPRHSLKQRQLELLGAGMKRLKEGWEKQLEEGRERVLEELKAKWISLGMMHEEDAHLLESVEGPYHPNIERSRAEYFSKRKEEEERMLEEKARKYYQEEWILSKEKELQELQKQEDAAVDPDTKGALSYMISVAVDALKLRFLKEEVPGLKKFVLLERRRTAIQLGWCSTLQAATITSIWSPLPFPKESDSEDDDAMFITPMTTPPSARPRASASQVSCSQKKRLRKKKVAEEVPKRARITRYFTQDSTK